MVNPLAKGRLYVVCPDFGRLGGNASLPLCTLAHFNAYELQRFTSWVALLAGFSRAVRWFYFTEHAYLALNKRVTYPFSRARETGARCYTF